MLGGDDGQPTDRILDLRRRSELITPVPKPRKRRRSKDQVEMVLGAAGLSSEEQEYNPTPIINEIRTYVDAWRKLPNPGDWQVTPETARLLRHWRHHRFHSIRPFFCQVEAVETAIWLTEVAGVLRGDSIQIPKALQKFREHVKGANEQTNPELLRIALKLATGAGKTTVMAMLIEGRRRPSSLRPRGEAEAGSSPDAGTEGWIASSRVASLGAPRNDGSHDFAQMILENLKAADVQQAHKEDRIAFTSLPGWPGRFICAEGTFMKGERQRRAGVFIGLEFGTVARPDLVAAAREAGDAGFDVLIACAFNYDAHSAEFDKLGRVPVLKARMNPDLHMGGDLKSTGRGTCS